MRLPQSELTMAKEQLQELYLNQGLSYTKIAETLNISRVAVWRKLKMFEISLKTPRGKLENITREEFLDLYVNKGFSVGEIARYYHVRQPTVRGRMERLGIPFRGNGNPGNKNPAWKGGVSFSQGGYVFVYLPPNSPFYSMRSRGSYIAEHRLVMAKHLGRCLMPWEIVHHGGTKYPMGSKENKADNRLENLELLPSRTDHASYSHLQHRINELEKQVRLLKFEIKMLHSEKLEPIKEYNDADTF